MKTYKNAKKTKRVKKTREVAFYEYECPFCETVFVSYSLSDDILMIRCSNCRNKIQFEDED